MDNHMDRRSFIKAGSMTLAGLGFGLEVLRAMDGFSGGSPPMGQFKISLAEWSLHRTLRAKKMDNLDFAKTAKEKFGIEAIEYVNSFFKDKAKDKEYLEELNKRAKDVGVKQLLIMIDGEGALGAPEEKDRMKTVENHKKWVEAAKTLGCHSIRVNAASKGTFDEQMKLAADGCRRLVEFAAGLEINVIVENHGGHSSNGQWLAGVMKKVDHPRFGTLPDFGNFYDYDRYKGVKELMPWAKAVSAKSYAFDEKGDETKIDYVKMMNIVISAGYRGYVGIEYEGSGLSEEEGIKATKKLLEKLQKTLI